MARYPKNENKNFIVGQGEATYKASEPDIVNMVFKRHQVFELHVGGQVFNFQGTQPRDVPRWVLTHHDFTDEIKNLFVIRGK